ncbi:MAG: c-type cytochrome [Chloroflexota bacterium]
MQPTFRGVLIVAALTAAVTLADKFALPASSTQPAPGVAQASAAPKEGAAQASAASKEGAAQASAAPKVAGNASSGKTLFANKGCVACHVAQGVPGAVGTVGPSLNGLGDPAKRPTLASGDPNDPANIKVWIKDPTTKKPGTLMPNLGLSDKEADDLTAFLVTLR